MRNSNTRGAERRLERSLLDRIQMDAIFLYTRVYQKNSSYPVLAVDQIAQKDYPTLFGRKFKHSDCKADQSYGSGPKY